MKKVLSVVIILIIVGLFGYFLFQDHQRATTYTPTQPISGDNITSIIVPHFNTFADKRLELLSNIWTQYSAENIILVSVDHFNSGSTNITTTDKDWTTSEGKLTANKDLVRKLADSGIATSDESAFAKEHGISNIVPDILKSKIGGSVTPIIIKDTTPRADVDKLADWISANAHGAYLIASVDFSHYQPNALAKVHDQFSIQALENNDPDKIWAAESDSPQTLYLAQKVAAKNSATNFNLFYNSNSGELNKNDDAETTSVVLGYYSNKGLENPPAGGEPSTSFVIAGDAMFDRNVWQTFKSSGLEHIFDNFGTRVFRGTDLAMINLEGPVSEKTIPGIQTGGMSFNFQPEVPGVLKYLNINSVSLANNHTNNAGTSGFASTKKMLDKSSIKYFGQPSGFSEASVLRVEGGIPVSIIGIMALDDFDESAIETKIKSEKSAGRAVIIFPHWGTEYAPKHSTSQKNMAKSWIAAGADLIIGSHPHVTEDFEIVDGKPVVYSLGNFVFDQFFSEETQQGLILAGTVTKEKITLTFLPTKEIKVKPQLMRGSEKINKIKTILDINSEQGFKKISSDTIEISR